jgi:hypothetical protein
LAALAALVVLGFLTALGALGSLTAFLRRVALAFSGAGAHADVEWVNIETGIDLAEILYEAVMDYTAGA